MWLRDPQIKGFPYAPRDLFADDADTAAYLDGSYLTFRLTSSMYHRFHAPHDWTTESISYMSGDTWNVNPIALKRFERLFCKNGRAAIKSGSPRRPCHHVGLSRGDPGGIGRGQARPRLDAQSETIKAAF